MPAASPKKCPVLVYVPLFTSNYQKQDSVCFLISGQNKLCP
ncbi:hypothetical protein [Escherichia coli IS35]|nr:hypothetical protein [Escherichia coli IS35]